MHGNREGSLVGGQHLFSLGKGRRGEGVVKGYGRQAGGTCVDTSFQEQCAHNPQSLGRIERMGKTNWIGGELELHGGGGAQRSGEKI